MKLEIEIEEPKYKIGDVIELMCGAGAKIPIIFAVVNFVEEGHYYIGGGKISYDVEFSNYYLSCQINYNDSPLTKWMPKRYFMVLGRNNVESRSKKIEWNKKILPAQTAEYLNAKDQLIGKIEKGEATIEDLNGLADNF